MMSSWPLTGRRFDESSSIADRSKHRDRKGTHKLKLEGEGADPRGLDRSEARTGPGACAAAGAGAQRFLALAIWLNVIAGGNARLAIWGLLPPGCHPSSRGLPKRDQQRRTLITLD